MLESNLITFGKKKLNNGIWNQWINPLVVKKDGELFYTAINSDGEWVVNELDSNGEVSSFNLGNSPTIDDHNAPCLVSGQRNLYVFYTGHNDDDVMRMRKKDGSDWSNEQTISFSSTISYAQGYDFNDNLIVFCRTGNRSRWSFKTSEDGGSTWSDEKDIINVDGDRWYMISKIQSDGITLNVAFHNHPLQSDNQNIYFCNINLDAGDIYSPSDTQIANLYDTAFNGLNPAKDCHLVYESNKKTRLFSVSDGNPVIVWADFNDSFDSVYKYAELLNGEFYTTEIEKTGVPVERPHGNNYYFGGADVSGNKIVYSSNKNSDWNIKVLDVDKQKISRVSRSTKMSLRPIICDDKVLWINGFYIFYLNKFDTSVYMHDLPTN